MSLTNGDLSFRTLAQQIWFAYQIVYNLRFEISFVSQTIGNDWT